MHSDTKHRRDRFTFSLLGTRAVNSHAMVPAIADNGINAAWDARLGQLSAHQGSAEQPDPAEQVEALLARYFGHGCCCST